MRKKHQKISLVIPAFKQEKTIVQNVRKISAVLKELKYEFEIIVVVDGRLDKTYEKIKKNRSKKIRVYQYKINQGKGYAVKYGCLRAKGDIIGFIDAGLDIDLTGVSMLLNHMIWYDADIIVGSKLHPVSKVNYPGYRKVLSWGYRTFTRLLFGFKLRDTQTGIKFYKSKVVKDVFPRLLVKTFAFDVEILALSYALGYRRIFEAPIKLNFKGANSITSSTLWLVVAHMIWDTMSVFYRVRILKYYRKRNKKNWMTK